MLKKTLLALPLLALSMSASAELLTTEVITNTFTGTAGNASTQNGIEPFTFAKFDPSLGTLTNVFFKSTFIIDNGLIGADNMTNKAVSGTGHLGGQLGYLNATVAMTGGDFQPLFGTQELLQNTTFNLEADPTLSTGGNGPDTATMTGGYMSDATDWLAVHNLVLDQYVSDGGDTSFTVDFDTNSSVMVDVAGAQGTFQAVDATVKLELYYQYESFPEINDVPAPAGLALAGLALMGFGAARRRRA